MEKVYEGFLNPKYHMWSQNVLFIPLSDTSPTHTGLRKKYMAACWSRILPGLPHQPEGNTVDRSPRHSVDENLRGCPHSVFGTVEFRASRSQQPALCHFSSGPQVVFLAERHIGILKLLLPHHKACDFFSQSSKEKLPIFLVKKSQTQML